MCGITGIISPDTSFVTKKKLQAMSDALAHRGPDGEACWINKTTTAGFSHRRLAIIDLSNAGKQPMHYNNRYTIVFNGAIYNYIELRESLINKGYTFNSSCDTEVILAAYACYGEQCLHHFDGMFAFAIWDEQEQCLFAARDRFGEKPFYFYFDAEKKHFLFASEIKGLIAAGIPDTRNDAMLLQYLASGLITNNANPYETFYKDIKKLPSRHFLVYAPLTNDLSVQPYYDIYKDEQIAAGDYIEQFNELFFTAVKRRLRSDVSIGTSLSGGLDSSSVVAVIHQLNKTTCAQKAFTASFKGFEKDESVYAKKVAERFGLQHYSVDLQRNNFALDMPAFFAAHDEPVSSASVYAQYKVYELAKQHGVKVLLDGQGADEILAGYYKYIHWYLQELYATRQFKLLKKERIALQQNNIPFNWGYKNKLAALLPARTALQLEKRIIKQQKGSAFLTTEYSKAHFNKHNLYKPVVAKLNDILYFDLYHSLEELLRYADTNSMAHGIEVRLPFLFHELVEFIFKAPSSCKINNGYTKQLLRSAMNELLPPEIVWRKDKIGFEPPQQDWMSNKLLQEMTGDARKKLVDERILKPSVLQQPVTAKSAYDADNYDWRYLSVVHTIF